MVPPLGHASSVSTAPRAMPAISGETVLVTGGAGFIGGATSRALLARGDNVVILDEMNSFSSVANKRATVSALLSEYGSRVQFFEGSICDEELVEKVFAQCRPSRVCHLAARAGVRPSIESPLLYVQANIVGTTVMLEAAHRHGVKNFVYASSSSVYGGSDQEVFRESQNVSRPCSQYAATKASCELMANTYHHLYNLNVTGLRFFTVYGPNGRPDMAPYKFVSRISRGDTIDVYGDGSSERDYTFIDDIVDGVIRALDRPLGCAVLNLGNGSPVTLKQFVEIIESLVGRKAVKRQLPMQPGDVPRTHADISEAQRLLGYNPATTLREGLAKTVKWYLATQSTLPNPLPVHSEDITSKAANELLMRQLKVA